MEEKDEYRLLKSLLKSGVSAKGKMIIVKRLTEMYVKATRSWNDVLMLRRHTTHEKLRLPARTTSKREETHDKSEETRDQTGTVPIGLV